MSGAIDETVDGMPLGAGEGAAHGRPRGLWGWLVTTNHKDIGTLYLGLSLVMLFAGGLLALLIRAELFQPGLQLMQPDFYNSLVTMHGLTMIFLVIMPALVGLANWQIPLMIGAPDMALPRINNWSFWLLPFATLLLWSGFLLPGGAPDAGWTFYAPLSSTFGPPSMDFMIFAIHLMGVSSVMGAINIVATIVNLRAPGLTLIDMPLFVWTWLITAFLLLLAMPVLAGVATMVLMDRHFGTSFFNAAGGGDPVLFQHVFWFFGHPEVYIMILPAFGVVSEIIPAFSRKPLFGRESMILAVVAIAFLSAVVWAHHMFTVGMPVTGQLFFLYTTVIIAIPTAIKVFNWIATMWQGSLTFETPMLWAISFVFLFTIGGLSGVMLANVPADYQYQDTYFVVAHLHYVLVTGSLFAIVAAIYFWLPKWTGHRYDERLGQWHFWLSAVSVNIAFFPMHFAGLAGMPRRIPDYALQFADFNRVSTVGAFVFGFSQLIFLWVIVKTVRGGEPAGDRPWDGARGLEWTLSSPPPYHSFTDPPAPEVVAAEGPKMEQLAANDANERK
jgi:cytochrome c oxidase subunit I